MQTLIDDAKFQETRTTKVQLGLGTVLSALPCCFLVFDGVIKLLAIEPVRTSFAKLGYPNALARSIGLLELTCLLVHLIPRTAVLGAILLTGYLGGAIATHVRVGDPLFGHVLFPGYVALLIWSGLVLRSTKLRALLLGPR